MHLWANQTPGFFHYQLSGINQLIPLSTIVNLLLCIYLFSHFIKYSRGPFSYDLFINGVLEREVMSKNINEYIAVFDYID